MVVANIRKLPAMDKDTATKVLGYMQEILDEYGWVSVADVCDLMGIRSYYEDVVLGWIDLRDVSVKRVWGLFRFRYKLVLPKPCDIRVIRGAYTDAQPNRGDELE